MNLGEMIQAALEDLNRDVDQQNREEYESKLIRYINAGYNDLLSIVRPVAQKTIETVNGGFKIADLGGAREILAVRDARGAACQLVEASEDEYTALQFQSTGCIPDAYDSNTKTSEASTLQNGAPVNGAVTVAYIAVPGPLRAQSDEPKYLPLDSHRALVSYAVYSELSTGSSVRQGRAALFYEEYMNERAKLYTLYARRKWSGSLGCDFKFGKLR